MARLTSLAQSRLCLTSFVMVFAWCGCAGYRQVVPQTDEARATVEVPIATDLTSLIVSQRVTSDSPANETEATTETETASGLSGLHRGALDFFSLFTSIRSSVTLRKLPTDLAAAGPLSSSGALSSPNGDSQNGAPSGTSPPDAASTDAASADPGASGTTNSAKGVPSKRNVERWQVVLRANRRGEAEDRLNLLLEECSRHVQNSVAHGGVNETQLERLDERISSLNDQLLEAELRLDAVKEADTHDELILGDDAHILEADIDPARDDSSATAPAVNAQIDDHLAQARQELEATVSGLQVLKARLSAGARLSDVRAELPVGSVRDAVERAEAQIRLSDEVVELDRVVTRFGDIYGERHPKLMEARSQFDARMADLGGWDAILNEPAAAVVLVQEIEESIIAQQDHVEELALRSELVTEQQLDQAHREDSREKLLATQKRLTQELADLQSQRASHLSSLAPPFRIVSPASAVEIPWLLQLVAQMGLVTAASLALTSFYWRLRGAPIEFPVSPLVAEPPEPSEVVQIPTLSLAERRAQRQARFQSVYGVVADRSANANPG